jgi:serine/threonine-protein kinase
MKSSVEACAVSLSPCPDRDSLVDFARGMLPSPEADSVADHLSSCEPCQEVFGEVQAANTYDSDIAWIVKCLEGPPLPDGPAFAEMERRAHRVLLDPTDPGTAGPSTEPAFTFGEVEADTVDWPYQIIEKIGSGGMGVVYRAIQVPLKRMVALKMIPAGSFVKAETVSRLVREGEAIARLRHPNVVQVHDLGVRGGLPYFSMELMEGQTLHARLRSGGPMAPREAAEVVRTLALAIAYAHREGVIHRDLKPSNILFAGDGTPKVADFGLAKFFDPGSGGSTADTLTEPDVVLGTPNYMSPEQASGSSYITGLTDVYALGAILYEALTGRPPFSGETKLQILHRVRSEPPTPPSQHRPDVPPWLEAICLKCLEKSPARRYRSAQELADDLGLWLRDERPLAVPSWYSRARRRVRKHLVAALLIPALLAIGALAYPRDPDRAMRQTQAELARGRAVTLIGPTGGPKWSRWRAGSWAGHTALAADRTFTIDSWSHGLLELVPDPQSDRYRITAQVRHETGDDRGAVGLYFAHKVYQFGPTELQFFSQLTFNSVRLSGDRAQLPPEFKPQGLVLDNAPELRPHFITDEAARPGYDSRLAEIHGPRFKPHGERSGIWHDLELTITPERVTAQWDGQPFGLATTDYRDQIHMQLKAFPPPPVAPLPKDFLPPFEARGGLGLYVYRGSASFRAVTITPQ